MISHSDGMRDAIWEGVRMMPDPIELPRETATPNVTPRMRSMLPLGAGLGRGVSVGSFSSQGGEQEIAKEGSKTGPEKENVSLRRLRPAGGKR
jgi:hypothetical protein